VRPLAVLRPEPGASATVERARALGLEAFAAPLFIIEPVEWLLPDTTQYDALILTSANALRYGGMKLKALRSLPLHVVGPATAQAARQAGLEPANVGSGGIDELLSELPRDLRMLHPCGENRREPVDAMRRITPLPVYRSTTIARPAGAERLTGVVALVHSPRAGERLAEIAPSKASMIVAAISPAAAAACGNGWEQVAIAEGPRDDALLSLGALLCKQLRPK
jgi:uroporphyrinogen-III synthase